MAKQTDRKVMIGSATVNLWKREPTVLILLFHQGGGSSLAIPLTRTEPTPGHHQNAGCSQNKSGALLLANRTQVLIEVGAQ